MLPFQIVVLGLVQALSEFLPIGGNGHLVLVPPIGWVPDHGLVADLAGHLGMLLALIIWFWRELPRLAGPLGGRVLLASLPALVLGTLLQYLLGGRLGSLPVFAWTTIAFALLLLAADLLSGRVKRLDRMKAREAFFLGLLQTLAFLPGSGRAGLAMVAARAAGYERRDAARFAFLLSIPAIAGIILVEAVRLALSDAILLYAGALGDAALVGLVAGATSLVTIAFIMAWLARAGFIIFVVYRLLIGAGLLYLV